MSIKESIKNTINHIKERLKEEKEIKQEVNRVYREEKRKAMIDYAKIRAVNDVYKTKEKTNFFNVQPNKLDPIHIPKVEFKKGEYI